MSSVQGGLPVIAIVLIFLSGAIAQKPKPRPAAPKAKAAAATQKKLDEQAEWDKATALTEPAPRIAALKKFIKNFPTSTRLTEASTLLVTAEFASANDKLVAGQIDDAADLYTAAAIDAPKPVPDQLWAATLSRIAANLYFRGARGEAFDVTKVLEGKAESSVAQLLSIANFYLNIENGTEAKRVAEAAIKLDANSAAAYQTLGLANRVDFQLDDSAAAFAKALELEPDSITGRRGLAEMKRSLGKADEAVALYREMLTKDEANVPARTGLILSLFDAGSRSDAEAEMARSLEANPGNVILLAGAAYWYAAHNEGDKAVDNAQKAIAADPRFIWSHIALARGFLAQNKPVEAEKTLLAARRYGNFPTLEYEIASARLAAGLYREAAEELARSFTVKEGMIQARLGGRVPRESKYFTELVGFERRASIFAPTAADTPESASQLRALLELKQALDAATPNIDAVSQAVDSFVSGDDKMKVHRQLFAANQLLERKMALPKVLELAKAAPQNLDAGLDVADASTAVLASELYETRKIAAAREDYVAVPAVPRSTLSSVLRGRIEDITGWAYYQMDDPAQATVHLRRAVSVLPADSAYLRASLWRLGTALMVSGKDAEALDAYVKSYKGSAPDAVRYNAIEAVYKRVNGSTDGLETKIGPNPAPSAAEVAVQRPEPSPAPEIIPAAVPVASPPAPQPTPEPAREQPRSDIPAGVPIATPTATAEEAKPSPSPTPEEVKPTPTVEASQEPIVTPTPAPPAVVTAPDVPSVVPVARPTDEAKTVPSPTREEVKPTPEPAPATEAIASAPTPERQKTPDEKSLADPQPENKAKELFPPVVITIPAPGKAKPALKPTSTPEAEEAKTSEEAKPQNAKTASLPPPEQKTEGGSTPDARARVIDRKQESAAEIRPCRLTVSEERLTLQSGGGDLAVVVGRADDNELDGLTATSTSPENVSVRRQVIEGMRTRALFVLHPGTKPGVYQVIFELPCGKREVVVRVR